MRLRRICVYCGARTGNRPAYTAAAVGLATAIARRGSSIVYGGGSVGIMGVVADAALAEGAEVIGVLPRALFSKEVAHVGLTALHEVDGMHARKALMMELADAFIALPGGFGTLEELFEALTWTQIGIHAKPCALLDVDGYFDRLLAFLDHQVAEGFVAQRNRDHLLVDDDPERLLDRLRDAAGRADAGLAVEWTTARVDGRSR
ncbi:MAG: TIGR00730 family Rossman fold protein [Planctomycetes bacterium]|nr:TIGR00730 family Rossman fold protein [Planctomycetota bacterium]